MVSPAADQRDQRGLQHHLRERVRRRHLLRSPFRPDRGSPTGPQIKTGGDSGSPRGRDHEPPGRWVSLRWQPICSGSSIAIANPIGEVPSFLAPPWYGRDFSGTLGHEWRHFHGCPLLTSSRVRGGIPARTHARAQMSHAACQRRLVINCHAPALPAWEGVVDLRSVLGQGSVCLVLATTDLPFPTGHPCSRGSPRPEVTGRVELVGEPGRAPVEVPAPDSRPPTRDPPDWIVGQTGPRTSGQRLAQAWLRPPQPNASRTEEVVGIPSTSTLKSSRRSEAEESSSRRRSPVRMHRITGKARSVAARTGRE
jgi:hypothetical protein